MRGYGVDFTRMDIPVAPDCVGAAIITTALAVVAQDWPAAPAPGNGHIVRFSSSAPFVVNPYSTGAAVPTTNSTGTTASTGRNIPVNAGARQFQIPGDSTGYSLTAASSGHIGIEFWRKG